MELLNIFKRNASKQQCLKYLLKQKSIRLKANSLIVLLAQVNAKKEKRELTQKAYSFYSLNTCQKIFQGLRQNIHSKSKVKLGYINQNVKLAFKVFNSIKLVRERRQFVQVQRIQRENLAQHEVFNYWRSKFERRIKCRYLLKKLEEYSLKGKQQSLFKKWQKGAFLMKICELFYNFQMKEKQEQLVNKVFLEWFRLYKHKINKEEQYQVLERNHSLHSIKSIFMLMRSSVAVKGRVLAGKLQKLLNPRYIDSLENIYQYGIKEQYLNEVLLNNYQTKMSKRKKQKYLVQWLIAFERREQFMLMQESKKMILLKKGLKGLEAYRLAKMEDKYQMLRIIQFFSEKRPELLLFFSKGFLHYNFQHSQEGGTSRVCSSALAKYIIEKWKNVKDILSVNNHQYQKAQAFNKEKMQSKVFSVWKEGQHFRQSKVQLKQSCAEFYAVSLLRKGFRSLNEQAKYLKKKNYTQQLLQEQLQLKCLNIFKHSFQLWHSQYLIKNHFKSATLYLTQKKVLQRLRISFKSIADFCQKEKQQRQELSQFQAQFSDYKEKQLMQKYFGLLKDYQLKRKQKQIKNGSLLRKAYSLYYGNLQKKIFALLRNQFSENKEKKRYSRMYSLFVAWKFYIKEKVLLNKYLEECNFTQSSSSKEKNKRKEKATASVISSKKSLNAYQDKQSSASSFSQQQYQSQAPSLTLSQQMKQNLSSKQLLHSQTRNNKLVRANEEKREDGTEQKKMAFTPTLGEPLNQQNNIFGVDKDKFELSNQVQSKVLSNNSNLLNIQSRRIIDKSKQKSISIYKQSQQYTSEGDNDQENEY